MGILVRAKRQGYYGHMRRYPSDHPRHEPFEIQSMKEFSDGVNGSGWMELVNNGDAPPSPETANADARKPTTLGQIQANAPGLMPGSGGASRVAGSGPLPGQDLKDRNVPGAGPIAGSMDDPAAPKEQKGNGDPSESAEGGTGDAEVL